MKQSNILAFLVFGLMSSIFSVPAFADTVLYSTLGPGGAYDGSSFFFIGTMGDTATR